MHKIINIDRTISTRLRLDPAQSPPWYAAAFLAHSGDSWLCLAALIALWALGEPDWRARAVLMAVAVAAQALVIFAVKQLIRRERPQGEWGGIYRSIDPHSFPSGHATRAVLLAAMAVVLGPGWFALVLCVWAPLVCLARVATGVHYLSDVLAGALIGLAMSPVMLGLLKPLSAWFPFLF